MKKNLKRIYRKAKQIPYTIISLAKEIQYTWKKIDRNQWKDEEKVSNYEQQMLWSWEETQQNAPEYFQRLKFSVEHAVGNVLEMGSGIGNMTRWLAKKENVNTVLAIDGFNEAISKLKEYEFPKVMAVSSLIDKLELPDSFVIDTLVMCEVIEHIYKSEEKQFLNTIKKHLAPDAVFIVSTPIGYMYDPHHTRYFSKEKFISYLEKHYGNILKIDYTSGYSQAAFGRFKG